MLLCVAVVDGRGEERDQLGQVDYYKYMERLAFVVLEKALVVDLASATF